MRSYDLGTTKVYEDLTWTGNGFAEKIPNRLWCRLPERLRNIAVEEICLGNVPDSILENKSRELVLLSLRGGPSITREGDEELRVHTRHDDGNYCYDGTLCTYEDRDSGCFLAFDDPDYVEEAF